MFSVTLRRQGSAQPMVCCEGLDTKARPSRHGRRMLTRQETEPFYICCSGVSCGGAGPCLWHPEEGIKHQQSELLHIFVHHMVERRLLPVITTLALACHHNLRCLMDTG